MLAHIMAPANWPTIWLIWGALGVAGGMVSDFLTDLIGDVTGEVSTDAPAYGFGEAMRRAAVAVLISGSCNIWLSRYYMDKVFDVRDMLGAVGSMSAFGIAWAATYALWPPTREQLHDWSGWTKLRK